jgi:hypothetical protein
MGATVPPLPNSVPESTTATTMETASLAGPARPIAGPPPVVRQARVVTMKATFLAVLTALLVGLLAGLAIAKFVI